MLPSKQFPWIICESCGHLCWGTTTHTTRYFYWQRQGVLRFKICQCLKLIVGYTLSVWMPITREVAGRNLICPEQLGASCQPAPIGGTSTTSTTTAELALLLMTCKRLKQFMRFISLLAARADACNHQKPLETEPQFKAFQCKAFLSLAPFLFEACEILRSIAPLAKIGANKKKLITRPAFHSV